MISYYKLLELAYHKPLYAREKVTVTKLVFLQGDQTNLDRVLVLLIGRVNSGLISLASRSRFSSSKPYTLALKTLSKPFKDTTN